MPSDLVQTKFIQISLGGEHTAGLTSEGKMHVWGKNDFNQSVVPNDLVQTKFIQISLGGSHTAGLTSEGKMQVWGWNL